MQTRKIRENKPRQRQRDRTTTSDTSAKQDCTRKQSADGAQYRCYARQREYEIPSRENALVVPDAASSASGCLKIRLELVRSRCFLRGFVSVRATNSVLSLSLCLSASLSACEPPWSRVAAVFAVDTALRLQPPRVASSAPFLLASCVLSPPRVHSRLLRGTRLSLTSNPKATHQRVPRETLGPYALHLDRACRIHRSFSTDICATSASTFDSRVEGRERERE